MDRTLFEIEPASEELLPADGSAVLHRRVLGEHDADRMFSELLDLPWQQKNVRVFGREVPQPRLFAWFGDPERKYTYSGLTLEPLPWSSPLDELRVLCESFSGVSFNSALANLYRDGSDSVSWHADDEKELGPDPVIASLSLGAERRFDLRNRESGCTVKTMLPSGSLVVMSGGCQEHWIHQLPKMTRVTEPRINITFRTMLS